MSGTENWSFPTLPDNEALEPTPDELDLMYQKLNSGELIELAWKSSGYRAPTPTPVANAEVKKNANTELASKNLEFDFMDEVASPTMRVQRPMSTPKSSTKKKTANFASVLDAMKKNKRLQSSKE
ncbi:uncharacterized protein LOC116342395 [Contarinia nasturtii]|uniref:uncharacterized protein LOC116342395 n=1 Tax=Contarinia nasturtii TaxID=265458 RepID=UPI0012D4868E|nr:uncharacterized protein LOC116342395 [Contarinia nasturtii]